MATTMHATAAGGVLLLALLLLSTNVARAEDPYVFFEWHVTSAPPAATASSASSAASSSLSHSTRPRRISRCWSATGTPRTTPSWPASSTPERASAAPRACSSTAGAARTPPTRPCSPSRPYRLRVCNVGIKASLNFRIQGHDMKLVEMEGSHTLQDMYESLDVHVGQCFSVLVDADQKPADYLMVASTRFMADPSSVSAVIRYAGSNTPPAANVPEPPAGWAWSINQWRSFRWNLTASAARPNPQGSYHYGQINITRTIKLMITRGHLDGKLRYGFNGVSHVDTETPLKLAEYFGISDQVFKYNQIGDSPPAVNGPMHMMPNVITAEFRTFIEVIFENPEKSMDSLHLDGYAFFAVGMGPGKWKPEMRKTYNLLDAVSRHTIQVYPRSWSAVMLTFDNAGMWNVRSNLWERHYLGEQLYTSVVSPARSLRDEYNFPEDALRCGKVVGLPLPPSYLPA